MLSLTRRDFKVVSVTQIDVSTIPDCVRLVIANRETAFCLLDAVNVFIDNRGSLF